ncbi:MAG: inositol-3-phosphate synthase [Elusimicrobiota bacterium]
MKDIIKKPEGKLAVLIPGMGAVTSTLIAGVEMVKKGIGRPFGSITQMQRIRLGKRYENRNPLIKDFVPLTDLNDLVFGGWDIYDDTMYEAALNCKVFSPEQLKPVKNELSEIKPMPGVFDKKFVKNLNPAIFKKAKNKMELAELLMRDIEDFCAKNKTKRAVMVWAASTEVFTEEKDVHSSIKKFEEGLKNNSPLISPSMIYAYAAIKMKVPFANGAPNLSVDIPALIELSELNRVPIAGKDFKTGQTLMKTIIAPGLKARMLGIRGWYSTNILGNRDGLVLDDAGSFKTKEKSKKSVLDSILEPELYSELYGNLHHKVRIDYYPPRGDAKEGWDNIDIFGWMNMPMQIKINFLCRDSILAAPVMLDILLFMDLAYRAGLKGIQEWMSFFFKSPMHRPDLKPENDLFIQHIKLKNTLRLLMREEIIDHSGLDYYESKFKPVVADPPKKAK